MCAALTMALSALRAGAARQGSARLALASPLGSLAHMSSLNGDEEYEHALPTTPWVSWWCHASQCHGRLCTPGFSPTQRACPGPVATTGRLHQPLAWEFGVTGNYAPCPVTFAPPDS